MKRRRGVEGDVNPKGIGRNFEHVGLSTKPPKTSSSTQKLLSRCEPSRFLTEPQPKTHSSHTYKSI